MCVYVHAGACEFVFTLAVLPRICGVQKCQIVSEIIKASVLPAVGWFGGLVTKCLEGNGVISGFAVWGGILSRLPYEEFVRVHGNKEWITG